MLKVLGAVLLIAGGAGGGLLAAAGLSRRVHSLRSFCLALELAERELSFRLTPTPELLERLSRQVPPPAGAFFARCREDLDHLGEESLAEIWQKALLRSTPDLTEEDRRIVAQVGSVLGRYDGPGQEEAFRQIRARLSHALERAEADRDSRGKVMKALGLTAGCFLAILLL